MASKRRALPAISSCSQNYLVANQTSSRNIAILSRPLRVANKVLFQKRDFQTEGEYHRVADETLETIQDVVEETLEEAGVDAEVTLASGVLTLSLPPHGTYVINKQTPNQQIWWSSPVSGPRRYEYSGDGWVLTRDASIKLGDSLREEFQELLDLELELEV